MVEIEKSPEYAKILFAIYKGNRTLTQISETLNKAKPTISAQLERLKKRKYIRSLEEKEGKEEKKKGYSVRWSIHKDGLVSYWGHIYAKDKFDIKFAQDNFEIWFSQISSIPLTFPQTIESVGHFFLIGQDVAGLDFGDLLNLPLKKIMYMNNPAYRKRAIKNMRSVKKKMKKVKK